MSTLAVNNIRAIVSCDGKDTVYENANLFCRDGLIEYIGPDKHDADTVIDGSGMLCYPGLVNAHHHLYQVFSRNLEKVQNMELFDWLKTLYEIWKNLNEDTVYLSSLTGMGELMKNGCTTVFDHHYVFPAGAGDLIGAQAAAADKLGVRMHFSRGSMDLSVKDGGLPPDSVVQTVDEIMKDSIDLIDKYHDRSFRSKRRIALAPCSPFSVSAAGRPVMPKPFFTVRVLPSTSIAPRSIR
jgi:cytosine/adenosine deaminase-related metal-dependent hydrolase